MCGIVGLFLKDKSLEPKLGELLSEMLVSLSDRGPDSAGIAIYVALASLVRDKPVRNDCAMTGEISLRGLVLPVGGIKEKVLAALQAGIKVVMLPERNRKEWEDIPEQARRQLQFVWLETVDDALREAINNLQSTI